MKTSYLSRIYKYRGLSTFVLSILLLASVGCGGKVDHYNDGKIDHSANSIPGSNPGAGPSGPSGGLSTKPGNFTTTNPTTGVVTRKACQTNKDCGSTVATCSNGKCYNNDNPCFVHQIKCTAGERCERGIGNFKDNGFCVPNCNVSEQCGGVCKTKANQICVANRWVDPCQNNAKHCITSTGPVCCTPVGGKETACVNSACVPVTNACDSTKGTYCRLNEYCDTSLDPSSPTAGRCVKYTDNKNFCVYKPKDLKNVKLQMKAYNVASYVTPVVADIDGDHYADIFGVRCCSISGALFAISGKQPNPNDPSSYTKLFESPMGYAFSDMTPAIAELDGDTSNGPEIVTSRPRSSSRSFPDGINIFHSNQKGDNVPPYASIAAPNDFYAPSGAITIGDINKDGHPEIVSLGTVYSYDAKHILFTVPFDQSKTTSKNFHDSTRPGWSIEGDIPVLADVNLDGYLDLIEGRQVFLYKGFQKDSYGNVTHIKMEQPTLNDHTTEKADRPYPNASYSAVADFIKNTSHYPQIVNTFNKELTILDYRGNILASATAPTIDGNEWTYPSAPMLADVDGAPDNLPEIGVTYNSGFALYKVTVDPQERLVIKLMWVFKGTSANKEISGGAVFDFDGDGKAEILYNDKDKFYILDPNDPNNRWETDASGVKILKTSIYSYANPQGSIWGSSMMPTVTDINNDGHADIVVSGTAGGAAVQVFTNTQNNWVPARPIMNQHAYDVTNINDNATVPREAKKNWLQPWLNNYRENVSLGNPFLAPDFIIDAYPITGLDCTRKQADKINIKFALRNIGSKGATKNSIDVKLVAHPHTGSDITLTTMKNKNDIPGGGFEDMQYTLDFTKAPGKTLAKQTFDLKIIADDTDAYHECNDANYGHDNNTKVLSNISASPRDLSIKVSTNYTQCISSKVPISVDVTNSSDSPLAANSTNITLYATIGSGTKTKIGTITVDKEIPAGKTITFSHDWTTFPSSTSLNKLIHIDAVIDESNNVVECNENNNTASTDFACQIYG